MRREHWFELEQLAEDAGYDDLDRFEADVRRGECGRDASQGAIFRRAASLLGHKRSAQFFGRGRSAPLFSRGNSAEDPDWERSSSPQRRKAWKSGSAFWTFERTQQLRAAQAAAGLLRAAA